jgi:hypothetical protein
MNLFILLVLYQHMTLKKISYNGKITDIRYNNGFFDLKIKGLDKTLKVPSGAGLTLENEVKGTAIEKTKEDKSIYYYSIDLKVTKNKY